MNKVKNAWEVAMERAAKIRVTPEEMQKQQRKKYLLAGRVLSERYLNDYDLKQLITEVNKFFYEERDYVVKTLVERLVESLTLGDFLKLEKVVECILRLTGNDRITETKGSLYVLFDNFMVLEKKRIKAIESAGRDILSRRGISGTAIQTINSADDKGRKDKTLIHPLEKEFERLKEELKSLLT